MHSHYKEKDQKKCHGIRDGTASDVPRPANDKGRLTRRGSKKPCKSGKGSME